jgi:methionyl-tRNA formyltransferase
MSSAVLLLTKQDRWSLQAGELARKLFGDRLIWEQGRVGDAPPASFNVPSYAAVVSFLSPWIVPEEVLAKSALSINFHPGSCDYPGIGCYNFALYEEAKFYGPVCHHMLPRVDTGTVIKEVLFPVLPDDRVETLKLRTMEAMLALFQEIVTLIGRGEVLPVSTRQWMRKAFTRKQLNALCEVTPDMDKAEANRRILATTYPGYPGPYLLVDGEKRFYPVPAGPPLA